MFDIGIGEMLILAVIGLLVFGPERLPKAAADAARMIRNVRSMATSARKDLADASGLDLADTKATLRDLHQFHPKRLVGDLITGDDEATSPSTPASGEARRGHSAAPRFDPDAT